MNMQSDVEQDVVSLQDVIAFVRHRWWLIVAVMLTFAVIAVGLSLLLPREYTARATVLVGGAQEVGGTVDNQEVATQADVVASDVVADDVAQQLDEGDTGQDLLERVTVTPDPEKRILTIEARGGSAAQAAAIANGFASRYLVLARDRAAATEKALTDFYASELKTARARLTELRALAQTAPSSRSQDIQTEIQALLSRQTQLQNALISAQSPGSGSGGNAGQILRDAQVPGQPSQPRPRRAGVFGAVLGLLVGAAVALLLERRDDRIRIGRHSSPSSIAGLPLVQRVPVSDGPAALPIPYGERAGAAYSALLPKILHAIRSHNGPDVENASSTNRHGHLLLVSAAGHDEHAVEVSVQLAAAAAQAGYTVVLVDADARTPSCAEALGVTAERGLTLAVTEPRRSEEYLTETPLQNLSLIAAVGEGSEAGAHLPSSQGKALWAALRQLADVVVVSAAPVADMSAAVHVAREADCTLLVATDGTTKRRDLQQAHSALEQVGARLVAVLLTE
jgi:capsular polysaccharide biosynthesis protein/Mrp family chromosome partitioning ATPase